MAALCFAVHRRPLSVLNVYSVSVESRPSAAEDSRMAEIFNFSLPALLVFRMNAVAEKAGVDVQTIVEQALDRYFADNSPVDETLPALVQSLEDEELLRKLDYR